MQRNVSGRWFGRWYTVLLLVAILGLGSFQHARAGTTDDGEGPLVIHPISAADIEGLIAYADTPAGDGSAATAVAASWQVGDPSVGKGLFEGTIRFENRGPPCLACHSVAGIGALGGGALGPDLTGSYGKFGEAGLIAFLATTPLPTMKPIFDDRPLTEHEQAHLAVFLQQAAVSERTAATVGQLALLGVAGAALLLLLMRIIWRRRLTEVRRPMVARSDAPIGRSRRTKRERQNTSPKVEGG